MAFRLLNVLVGTWLAVSALGWPHAPAQKINAIICGLLAVILGVLRFYWQEAQYAGAVVAVWVFFFSVFTLLFTEVTLWNNALCGVLLFATALTGDRSRHFVDFPRRSTAGEISR